MSAILQPANLRMILAPCCLDEAGTAKILADLFKVLG